MENYDFLSLAFLSPTFVEKEFFVWLLAIISFSYPTLYAIWTGCLSDKKLKKQLEEE
jgi:hypothetical protein|tara:strand:+ start:3027 stop:3197 length:171 start_codon:yes stop_codon:yes gene_type:complete